MNNRFISTGSIKIVLPPNFQKENRKQELETKRNNFSNKIFYCYKDRFEEQGANIVEDKVIKIGRSEKNDIVITSLDFRDEEIAIIKMEGRIYFQSIHSDHKLSFNGIKTSLYEAAENSRVIIKLKQHFIIYDNRSEIATPHPLSPHISASNTGQDTIYSDLTPILIGNSPICDFKLDTVDSYQIHAFIFWSYEGIKLNIYSKTQKQELNLDLPNETLIQLHESDFFIQYHGNISNKLKACPSPDNETPLFFLLDLETHQKVMEIPENAKTILTRDSIKGRDLSPAVRILLNPMHNRVRMENQTIKSHTWVNGSSSDRHSLHAGDTLEIEGKCFLVLRAG